MSRRLSAWCFAFGGALFLGFGLFFSATLPWLFKPAPEQNAPVYIVLNPHTSATQFIAQLDEKGLFPPTPWYAWDQRKVVRYALSYHHWASQLKTGVYQIHPGESVWHLIGRVVAGDVLVLPFGIINGTTQAVIAERLQQAAFLNYTPHAWEIVSGAELSKEGLLLADTYDYKAGSDADGLLKQANRALWTCLDKAWQDRDPRIPYKTPYALLIAASILEKETALPLERRLISGIIINRLAKHMPLQMDPTVIYGRAETASTPLTRTDLSTPSPYNTYLVRGLPPTPIAMVGRDAIDAAAHPTFSNYLYFVSNGQGGHVFSETYQAQKQAVQHYRTTTTP